MIELMTWDTEFFGRRMGVLFGPPFSEDAVAADLERAAGEGFDYLLCRPPVTDASAVRTLERAGFYLTDIGVTWASTVERYQRAPGALVSDGVRLATTADVPLLAREAVKLFRNSRFYHDPFFSHADADRLHEGWLANSVSGQAADAVWLMPDTGFVTCKVKGDVGDIPLIGVWEGSRKRGGGRTLMNTAVAWFGERGVQTVHVRTQMKNIQAMNFYHRLGFDLHAADMTMGWMPPSGASQERATS
jgi:dTDP-4-amino-4,6-dideoxy-D-galactose acyltransferase